MVVAVHAGKVDVDFIEDSNALVFDLGPTYRPEAQRVMDGLVAHAQRLRAASR